MKTAAIIILAVLVVLLGSGFLVSTGLLIWQMKKNAALEDDPERVLVIVAAFDMPEGLAIINPNVMLMVKAYPKNLAPINFVSNPNDLVGAIVKRNVDKGEPITTKMVHLPGSGR